MAHLDVDGVVAIGRHLCQRGRDPECQESQDIRVDIIRAWRVGVRLMAGPGSGWRRL